MKRLSIYLALITVMLLCHVNSFSQEPKKFIVDTLYVDNIPESQIGNLELLIQRIHTAFALFSSKSVKGKPEPLIYERKDGSYKLDPIKLGTPKAKREVEAMTVNYEPKNPIYGSKELPETVEIRFKSK